MTVQVLLSWNENIAVLSTLFPTQIQNIIHTNYCETVNSIPAKTSMLMEMGTACKRRELVDEAVK